MRRCTRPCQQCGEAFRRHKAIRARFCCRSCAEAWTAQRWADERVEIDMLTRALEIHERAIREHDSAAVPIRARLTALLAMEQARANRKSAQIAR